MDSVDVQCYAGTVLGAVSVECCTCMCVNGEQCWVQCTAYSVQHTVYSTQCTVCVCVHCH